MCHNIQLRRGPSISHNLLESHNVVWVTKGQQINDCTFATSDLSLSVTTQWMKWKINNRREMNVWGLVHESISCLNND